MSLLCARPHEKFVDFGTARFVVRKQIGLDLGHTKLELGDELPAGELAERALRLAYRARMIEALDYALTEPDLREACARRGVNLEPAAASRPAVSIKFPKKPR